FAGVLAEARTASADVLRALQDRPNGQRAPARRPATAPRPAARVEPEAPSVPDQPDDVDGSPSATTLHLSVHDQPWLLDHSFFRIPAGWPDPSDGFPVVPMTNMIQLMADAAAAIRPGRVVTRVQGVRALRWLAVTPPVDVSIKATPIDDDTVKC